jgi:TolB-like protein
LRYLFEEYTFDTNLRELHRRADVVSVAPQVFDLLEYLIRNRERLVSKDDLINAVWNGRVVSDAALTTRLNAARSAIGDTGEKQHLIRTMPRKGFRFVGAVHQDDGRTVAPPGSAASGGETPIHTSTPRLSIVVLPFANIGGDREQDYFIDGVTESLTTDLSRINGAFVIAHSTSFTFKGKAVDVTKLGRELNVRYVLEGSVQRGGNRLRVNVQLIDAETGAHLWADRFDKPVADLFDMQDEIAARLANTLHAQLTVQEARRSERSPLLPNSMDLYFQGRALLYRGWTPDYMAQACEIFKRALVLDPDNIDAMLWTAAIDLIIGTSYLSDEKAQRVAAAEAALYKVLSLAPNYAWGHMVLGTLLVATNRAAEGIHEFECALALDSNLAEAHAQIGWTKYFMGRSAETEAHINEAFRLSPRDIFAYRWMMMIGFAKLHLNADAEALDWFRRSIEANRNSFTHFGLAAALALLGARDEARAAAKAGLALMPSFTIRRFREGALTDNPTYLANRERIYQGLRMAGVPEE